MYNIRKKVVIIHIPKSKKTDTKDNHTSHRRTVGKI